MKTVILINEDNHGLIGVAKDYKSALMFLLNEHWIDDYTEICIGDYSLEWKRVSDVFGEEWLDKMMGWDVLNFNKYWEGSFRLSIEEVIGTE